ncbi:MAG: ABC transporter permease [Gammaproteobacteria bacterium]|nr:ABC transporter permease [Gammaproteobacteria bacterium]
MHALNRKLVRELWRLRGQVSAVAMVVGSGVAVLVMSMSTFEALSQTTEAYYERYRFAEVFAGATRAPDRVAQRIADIPGVQFVQTRITRFATLDIEGFAEPAIGRLTSIPEDGQPQLNQLALRSGRWIAPDRHDEVIVNEPFAEAHALEPGDQFSAIINSRRRTLTVVGTALSPEFIYALGPGALLPDDQRFGIIWMGEKALEAAFDLENSFNDLSVTLLRDVAPEQVIEQIDALLERYGGISAIPRADQISHWFVMNELNQLRTMSSVLPVIFLSVAAFLCYMVLTRLIATERSEIGLLKAFGYSNLEVAWHYTKFVIAIAAIGSIVGWILGGIFGRTNTQLYAETFRFPLLIYAPSTSAFFVAAAVSLAATLAGALGAVRRVVKLPPAESMRPPAPAVYRRSHLGDSGLGRWLDQPTRIALRQIGRWPVRAGFTCIGIAASVGLLIMALQWDDSIDYIAENYFFSSQHQTMSIGLAEPQAMTAVREFEHMPGVLTAEPWRTLPADFSVGTKRHRGGIIGIARDSTLQPIYDEASGTNIAVPEAGLVLSRFLAQKLGVGVGDAVWVEVLEGRRPSGLIPVAAVFQTTIAMPAYMEIEALNRWMKVRPTVEYINLLIDPAAEATLFAELKATPEVSAVMLRQAALDAFYDTVARNILVYIFMFTGFACALGFGVAYNSTRIALSERGRELATLRVLGFTRGEISYILLSEVALIILAALPLGCVFGHGLALVLARSFDTELFRMPFAIGASTYGLGVVFAVLATVASAALVGQRIAHLDLIRVLKTRE